MRNSKIFCTISLYRPPIVFPKPEKKLCKIIKKHKLLKKIFASRGAGAQSVTVKTKKKQKLVVGSIPTRGDKIFT